MLLIDIGLALRSLSIIVNNTMGVHVLRGKPRLLISTSPSLTKTNRKCCLKYFWKQNLSKRSFLKAATILMFSVLLPRHPIHTFPSLSFLPCSIPAVLWCLPRCFGCGRAFLLQVVCSQPPVLSLWCCHLSPGRLCGVASVRTGPTGSTDDGDCAFCCCCCCSQIHRHKEQSLHQPNRNSGKKASQ